MLDLATDTTIPLPGGELRWWPRWLSDQASAALLYQLRTDTPWQQSRIRIAGQSRLIPRLNAWYGERGTNYGYSGMRLNTIPWTPTLAALKKHVEAVTGQTFNSALVNCYRDGNDSVDWHSDDEPELGRHPVVASLSLGVARRFELKHRTIPQRRYHLELQNGSLLLMAGALQHHWLHRVPKQRGIEGERLNVTFRRVASIS